MKIAYLLDRPELGGGVKVAFQHAALLARGGHRVWVAGRGPRPAWAGAALAPQVRYVDLEAAAAASAPGALPAPPHLPESLDLLLATYWTTLAPARAATRAAAGGRPRAGSAAQLLQGYEPDWPHQRHRAAEIEAAYREAALPALAVAAHLGEDLEARFSLPWRPAPPPVDPRFRLSRVRRWTRRRPRRRPWVVVPGIFEAEVKGVPVALEAIRRLRAGGVAARLLRVSVLPQGDAERSLLAADRFLTGVSPPRVAAALRTADLMLFPAREGEGFGLPLLEALASGVPAVASRLAPSEEMTGGAVPLVPPGDAAALADAARELLTDGAAWRRARRAARRAAERYRADRVAPVLEEAVAWAARHGRLR